ncbi:hypothetical protein ACH5RR_029126 [Cinchona calisaya]|uniref:Uncharacterized protein n=1 Tax=Cinchona calisaya TaxID=153742 RepID=A0ABD2YUN8_9GENT
MLGTVIPKTPIADPKEISLDRNPKPNYGKSIFGNPNFKAKEDGLQLAKKNYAGGKQIQWILKDSMGAKKDMQTKSLVVGFDCPSSLGVSVAKKLLDTSNSQQRQSQGYHNCVIASPIQSPKKTILKEDISRIISEGEETLLMEKDISDSLSNLDLVNGFDCSRPVVMGILHDFLESLDAKLSSEPDNSQPNDLPMSSKVQKKKH